MKTLIVYASESGFVKRYVGIIGSALKCDAVDIDKLKLAMIADYERIVMITSIRGGDLYKFKQFGKFINYCFTKLVVIAVGMRIYSEGLCDALKADNLPMIAEPFVPVFYLRGGFDLNKLGRMSKLRCGLFSRQIATVPEEERSKYQSEFAAAIQTPVDYVSKENAEHVIAFLNGEEVDATLYSPAELTPDKAEEHFREISSIERVTEDDDERKKKELKNKLKKKLK